MDISPPCTQADTGSRTAAPGGGGRLRVLGLCPVRAHDSPSSRHMYETGLSSPSGSVTCLEITKTHFRM